MIIKNKVENEPVLSNVNNTGEFRIRNSAKAFNILSSGLYANKIRAIIREYSCNAADSHVESGKFDTPFDVHLPNSLEPWFAVRDYGVGLDEVEVRNIFTTYFESTKTATDELIGGLGLGSKSAFSYTDNFTVVAVKNGTKRVFTAFINNEGIPSIAPMGEESSNEPNGVEIRFAVEDSQDFRKFYNEARHVYKHFKLRPVVSGGLGEFEFIDPEYSDRDIIPGVHSNKHGYTSYAVMGNIEYPLDVPVNMDLGDVSSLLRCGLTIEFDIGELDIQASREGLSYIPETVAAIKTKLEALNNSLTDRIAEEVATVKNAWEKAYILANKIDSNLWCAAAKEYITDTGFALITDSRYGRAKQFLFDEQTLENKYNIVIRAFRVNYNSSISRINTEPVYNSDSKQYEHRLGIAVNKKTQFVINDTTVGASERAKYHWKNDSTVSRTDAVYVIEKADKKKEMNTKAFFRAMSNPPKRQIHKASSLMKKERVTSATKGATILKLECRDNKGYTSSSDLVWRNAGSIEAFNKDKTYYYLPLNGFKSMGKACKYDMKSFVDKLNTSEIFNETVYGVRKADIEVIRNMDNWINLDDFVIEALSKPDVFDVKSLIKEKIGFNSYFRHRNLADKLQAKSPYLVLYNEFKDVSNVNKYTIRSLESLFKIYDIDSKISNLDNKIGKYQTMMNELAKRYPLLSEISSYYHNSRDIAEYINAIDAVKGINN